MLIHTYAVRVDGGDLLPFDGGRMMVRGEGPARDHRTAALEAFRRVPAASHVFTSAEQGGPLHEGHAFAWRRSMFERELGGAQ